MTNNLSGLASFIPLLLFLSIAVLIYAIRARRASRNYDWYKRQHPQLVRDGRVKCHKCGSGHLGTERLMNRSYLRAHICRQCGTTLYYSREGR